MNSGTGCGRDTRVIIDTGILDCTMVRNYPRSKF